MVDRRNIGETKEGVAFGRESLLEGMHAAPDTGPAHARQEQPRSEKGAQHAKLREPFIGAVVNSSGKPAYWFVAVLVALIFVPLACMALPLFSNVDPYGNMNKVPAVIVNLDKGVEVDGTTRNAGRELCDKLIELNGNATEGEVSGYSWQFKKDEAAAASGLRDGEYYLELVIPENFSETVTSLGDADSVAAELLVYYNPSLGYETQVVGENFLKDVVAAYNQQLQTDCFDNVFVTIKEAGDDLLTVANAGLDLTDGLGQARDGGTTLTDGLGQLADGSGQLTSGLNTAASGADQLSSGVNQLASGVSQLADGLNTLKTSLEQSSTSPDTVALANAMADVGKYLQLYGEEASKAEPDEVLEQQYLDAAASAASAAAAANKSLGDPLVAYISGGTFTYTSGSTTVSSTEQGLIPALANYAKAKRELEEFENEELMPLLTDLKLLASEVEGLGEDGSQAAEDLETYAASVVTVHDAGVSARQAYADYRSALVKYDMGLITKEELDTYEQAYESASEALSAAEEQMSKARDKVSYDLYHEDASGNPAGLLPRIKNIGDISIDVLERIGSIGDVETLINKLITLITNEAAAGAAAQGAAGKCEGYLVGVAVTSSYASGSTSQLTEAIGTIYSAVAGSGSNNSSSVVGGISQLSSGAASLAEGIHEAADGSQTITVSLGTVASGASSLADGLNTATSTSSKLFTGLLSGQKTLSESTENSDSVASVLSNPVETNEKGITTVANYGTSLAPFLFAAALWLGCLFAALTLSTVDRRKIDKKDGTLRIVAEGYAPIAVIAIAQAIVSLAVIQFGFSMNVNYAVLFYLLGILAALVFAAANQLLVGHFGFAGAIASLVLWAAQICVASGLFPVQAALAALSIIAKFLPITYVVSGLRVAMCGLDAFYVGGAVVALIIFLVVFLALTSVLTLVRGKIAGRILGQHGGNGVSSGASSPVRN